VTIGTRRRMAVWVGAPEGGPAYVWRPRAEDCRVWEALRRPLACCEIAAVTGLSSPAVRGSLAVLGYHGKVGRCAQGRYRRTARALGVR
jgi:hypothetical protein